ncbi:MAG: hypothetical protein EKK69_05500 [Candidatus Competibacteraceae bacterium]|nr:MAG: hypothetical protein EKK69_05500 [Candidatus Competibacteraceae bacterium]
MIKHMQLSALSLCALTATAIAAPPSQNPLTLSSIDLDRVTAGGVVNGVVTASAIAYGPSDAITDTSTFSSTTLSPGPTAAQNSTLVVVVGSATAYGGLGGTTATATDSAINSATTNTVGHTYEISLQGHLASSSTVFAYELGRPAQLGQGASTPVVSPY